MPATQVAGARMAGPPPLRTSFRAPTAFDKEAIKRRAYVDHNFIAISMDDPRLSWADKMALQAIADQLYGKRE